MITTKKITEIVNKAEIYDEIYDYFIRMIAYRDGLMLHCTTGYKEKANLISKKRFQRKNGQLKYYNEYHFFVDSHKIENHQYMAMQQEINRLNIILDTLSIFIQINKKSNEDRITGERENREFDQTNESTQGRTPKRHRKIKGKLE